MLNRLFAFAQDRLDKNRRDPWEAAEAKPGQEERARQENRHVV